MLYRLDNKRGRLMNSHLTITLAGKDHPQLINQLAAKTHELGGKWLVSKISRLDQQLVGIIKVEIPDTFAEQLESEFNKLSDFYVNIVKSDQPQAFVKIEHVTLKVESSDRPGIVNDITNILHDIGINIDRIENHRIGVPDLGKTLFFAELSIDVPSQTNLEQLIESVQQVEGDMRVEVVD